MLLLHGSSPYAIHIQAAKIDMKTVWEAAMNGAEALSQYDTRIHTYTRILLDESSITLQRELKTIKENQELDKLIQKLLNFLTLYASLKPTHLIIEYLIRYLMLSLSSTSLFVIFTLNVISQYTL